MGVVILGIESSCDDTSAAILKDGVVLSNVIASQKVHEAYGGVVPELASRAHQQNIIPVVAQALKQAGISENEVNAVAFTRGPGLLGSLLVGTSFAKGFAIAKQRTGCGIPSPEIPVPNPTCVWRKLADYYRTGLPRHGSYRANH